jgi:hypothetical protein
MLMHFVAVAHTDVESRQAVSCKGFDLYTVVCKRIGLAQSPRSTVGRLNVEWSNGGLVAHSSSIHRYFLGLL